MVCATALFDTLQPTFFQVDNDSLQHWGVDREEFEAAVSEKVTQYKDLLKLMDVSFSCLHTIDPSAANVTMPNTGLQQPWHSGDY